MKVKHYNEMMSYLTRPGFNGGGSVSNNTVLPKRKPAAEVKKRKKINYEKIKQYLGKESQDLIERELGFAIGGGVSPNQLKQRFMELIISIQDAEAEEVPMLVAEAKDLKDKIDELNKVLAPERQIQITSQGLDFDNPLIDAAKIQESVKPIQDIVPKSLTTENPLLKIAVPDFPKGDKGTLADPEEKEDVLKREPGKRIATMPDGTFTKASMRAPTSLRDMIKDVLKKFDKEEYPEIKTEDEFADGGRSGFKKGGIPKDFRKLPDDVKDVGNVIRDLIKTPGGKRIARNIVKAGKFTGLGLAGELAFAAPFAADDYASGLSKERIIGNAFLASLTGIGQSEDEEIRKAVGERGYATQTLGDLGQKIPIIADQLKAFNNQNDPTGAQRDKFTKIYNKVVNEYDQAYNLFVTDAGVFDKELYNQGVNNYAAGLGQIEKLRAAKEKERGVKEASKNITGLEDIDLNFSPTQNMAGGGIAKEAGDESGKPPESGPTPQGLASIIKRGRKY